MEDETMVPMTVEEDEIKVQDQNGFDARLATEETYDPEEIRVCLPTPESFADKKPTFKARVERSLDVMAEKIGHRGLVMLTIFLVLLLAVVVILLMWPRVLHHTLAAKCTKPHCLRAAAMYVETMNRSVDPCTDPWQWACGSWLNDNTTRLRGNWAKRDELWLQELTKVRDIVSSMTDVGGPDTVNWKLKTLYESCMTLDDIEGDHHYPLKKLIFELVWRALLSRLNGDFIMDVNETRD